MSVTEAVVFKVDWGAASNPGAVRDHNEDAWLATQRVFLVADGVGGHEGGERASRAVVDAFASIGADWLTAEALHAVLDEAFHVVTAMQTDGRAPGSTVVGAGLTQQDGAGYWLIFNLGDSRAYLLRRGLLEQISVDHSRLQELKDAGMDAEDSVGRNVITRAIGAGVPGPALADQWLLPAQSGDRILLCSDGLNTELSDQLIAATLLTHQNAQLAADELVRAALVAGGHDNVTALVLDALEVTSPLPDVADEQTLGDLTELIEATLPDSQDLWQEPGPKRRLL